MGSVITTRVNRVDGSNEAMETVQKVSMPDLGSVTPNAKPDSDTGLWNCRNVTGTGKPFSSGKSAMPAFLVQGSMSWHAQSVLQCLAYHQPLGKS